MTARSRTGARSTRARPRVAVRDYRPSDRRSLEGWYRELEVHIARTDPEHLVVDLAPNYARDYATSSLRVIRANRGIVLVVEVGGKPVGFLTGRLGDLPSRVARYELRPSLEGRVADVFVEEWARGTGAGRALFREAERRLRAMGADHLKLGVAAGNLRAREFYRSWGFHEDGLRLRKDLAPRPRRWEEVRRRRARAMRAASTSRKGR